MLETSALRHVLVLVLSFASVYQEDLSCYGSTPGDVNEV